MKLKTLKNIFLFFISISTLASFSQEKEVRVYVKKERENSIGLKRIKPYKKREKFKLKKINPIPVDLGIDEDFYTVFTDFRIPVREGINESDLIAEGWSTEQARYAFRCKDEKRVRLTFWSYRKEGSKFKDSEFINVTEEADECHKNDLIYTHKAPKAKPRRALKEKSNTAKDSITTKFKKEKKKKKFKAWEGVKK